LGNKNLTNLFLIISIKGSQLYYFNIHYSSYPSMPRTVISNYILWHIIIYVHEFRIWYVFFFFSINIYACDQDEYAQYIITKFVTDSTYYSFNEIQGFSHEVIFINEHSVLFITPSLWIYASFRVSRIPTVSGLLIV